MFVNCIPLICHLLNFRNSCNSSFFVCLIKNEAAHDTRMAQVTNYSTKHWTAVNRYSLRYSLTVRYTNCQLLRYTIYSMRWSVYNKTLSRLHWSDFFTTTSHLLQILTLLHYSINFCNLDCFLFVPYTYPLTIIPFPQEFNMR